jgi:VanZ family protein
MLLGPRVWLAFWGPPLAWMAFIFFLSAQPRPDAVVPIAFEGDDTLAHLALYTALGFLLWRAAYRGGGRLLERRPGRWTLAIGCAYAVSDEIHQAFVPVRSPQLADVTIDSVGVAFGIALGWLAFGRHVKRPPAREDH